ncbi:DUF4268 domain-containing protein [Acidaminococcus fermentans]|jgi:hypothetical protein
MEKLGRMKKIDDLRSIWPHEEADFSKWLAAKENLEQLSDAIGIDLEFEETESSVGSFSVDIYARESGSSRGIIIENQLEDTDHDHLGKIITYAAGKDAEVIVWIVKKARDEHKKAIEWLNQHTDENIGIFLIEIELWRIGDSLPAPRFNVVERPNEWAKTVKAAETLTPLRKLQLDFWQRFCDYAFKKDSDFGKIFSCRKAFATNWYNLSTGVASVVIEFTINTSRHRATAGVYIGKGRDWYLQLKDHEQEIEKALGEKVEWSEGEKDTRMLIPRKLGKDFDNQEYSSYYDWFMEKAVILKKIVNDYNYD